MGRHRVWLRMGVSIMLSFLLAHQVDAAGALLVNGMGQPLRWDTTKPVPFNPDQGPLGLLENAEAVALITRSLGVWGDVATSVITFEDTGALPFDVTASNFRDVILACNNGLSPIVFDTDGSIIDLLLGIGSANRVLGFAGPKCGAFEPPVITESLAILNGRFIDGDPMPEVSVEDFTAVIIHELGHYFNLDHTQINLREALDNDPTNDAGIPTMFPILVNGMEQSMLHLDDQASVSILYSSPDFFSSTGAIQGQILQSDGITPFQGANVIARNTAAPLLDAVSNISGALFFPENPGGVPPAELEGLYEIFGLTPGATYTVEIEAIDSRFVRGSSVGPVDPPASLPGLAEFWNGENESSDPEVDDPQESVAIPVHSGEIVTEVDIILNRSTFPLPPPFPSPFPFDR